MFFKKNRIMSKYIYWEDEWNEQDYPLKNAKRIRNEHKRNKIKNNRSRSPGSGATDKSSEGADY